MAPCQSTEWEFQEIESYHICHNGPGKAAMEGQIADSTEASYEVPWQQIHSSERAYACEYLFFSPRGKNLLG